MNFYWGVGIGFFLGIMIGISFIGLIVVIVEDRVKRGMRNRA